MRPNQQNNNNNKNRSRGRNNNGGRKHGNPLSRNYESNGPDVKVRGNAAHVAEKYLQLARDAQSAGDSVMAENYLQHAEHYFRIISAAQQAQQAQFRGEAAEEDDYDDDFAPINDRFASPEPRVPVQPQPNAGNGNNGNNFNNNNGNQQPQQQYVEQQRQADPVEAAPVEAQAPAEGGDVPAAEGDGAPRRRDRRPRRRSRGGGTGEGGAEGNDPAGAPQPDIGLPAFLTAGTTPAE